jgi:DNA-binding NtrC family response regulator
LQLDSATKARLESETWSGNVRELRNVLERALILADGPVIRPEHLWIEGAVQQSGTIAPGSEATSLADLERQTIERTLAAVGGNRRQAATKLGIGLRTLYEKLKRYDLR